MFVGDFLGDVLKVRFQIELLTGLIDDSREKLKHCEREKPGRFQAPI